MASPVTFPKTAPAPSSSGDGASGGSAAGDDLLSLPPLESSRDKFWRKLKEQPAIPIGSLLTCAALIAASHHLRKGNRDQFQRALRWRVGLQGLTVAAAVAGSVWYGAAAEGGSVSGGQTTPKFWPSPSDSPAAPGARSIPRDPSSWQDTSSSSDADAALRGITTAPGRPATNMQAQRAAEKREDERAALAERIREAIAKEERQRQAERDEMGRQLAAEAGLGGSAAEGEAPKQRKPRPVIGQDTRWSWRNKKEE